MPGFYERFRWLLLTGWLLLMPFLIWWSIGALGTTKNDFERWLPKSAAESRDLRWFLSFFESQGGPSLVLSWDGCTLRDPRIREFTSNLLGNARSQKEEGAPNWSVVSGLELIQRFNAPPMKLPERVAIDRLVGTAVGSDRNATWLFAVPPAGMDLKVAIAQLYQAASRCGISPAQLHVVGPAIEQQAMNVETSRLFFLYSPIAGVIAVACAWCCLGSLRGVFVLFATALISVSVGLSIVFLSSGEMSALMALLPALWFVLSISSGVHIIGYYRQSLASGNDASPVAVALRQGWVPSLLSTTTTAVGLSSLMISELQPVRDFGLYASLGLIGSFLVLVTLLPALLAILPVTAGRVRANRWRALLAVVFQWRVLIAAVLILVATVVSPGTMRIGLSSKLLAFFKPSTKIYRDYQWIESNVGPLLQLEILIRIESHAMALEESLELCRSLERQLSRDLPDSTSISTATMVPSRPKGRGVRGVAARVAYRRELRKNRSKLKTTGFLFDDKDDVVLRITVRTGQTHEASLSDVLATARMTTGTFLKSLKEKQRNATRLTLTGSIPLLVRIHDELEANLFESFIIAFALIFIIMVVALRSLALALVAMIPNVFPLVMTFGIVGWANIMLDVGGVMTASIALGIAVDDTLHFLIWFSKSRRQEQSVSESVLSAYNHVGSAMVQTTVICGVSMSVFVAATFVPAVRFGGMMFVLLIAALIGDLLLLPALLALRSRRGESRGLALADDDELDQRLENP